MNNLTAYLGFGFLLSEIILARWRHSSRETGTKAVDSGSLRLFWWLIGGVVTVACFLAGHRVGPPITTHLPLGAMALTLFVLGTVLRWWAIRHLGRFFTVDVAVADDQRVVDTGPYRLVRHPSYTGLLLQFAGWALTLNNILGFLLVLAAITAAVLNRIRVEERALLAQLGPPYAKYTSETKKLVPLVY